MYCVKCGHQIVEGSIFCAKCGTRIVKDEEIENNENEVMEKKPKPKKKKMNIVLAILLLISFAVLFFGVVNLYDVYDYYLFRTTYVDESVQIVDTNFHIQSDELGVVIPGSIQSPDGATVAYDEIFDDDTTQDGFKDRRTYYIADELVFASWDENLDGVYELSMKISEGLYVDTEYVDNDNDGNIDEISQYNPSGEIISINEEVSNENEMVNSNIDFLEMLAIQDVLLIVIPLLLAVVFLILLVKSYKKPRAGEKFICFLITLSLIGSFCSSQTYAMEIYDEDGTVNMQVFDMEWEKYSDFDARIPSESRSFPAQQYMQAQEQIVKMQEEIMNTIAEKEMLRLEYITLAALKDSVAKGHTRNVLKTIIRLAVLTYRVSSTSASVTKGVAKLGPKAMEIAKNVKDTVDPVNLSLMLAVPATAAGTVATSDEIKSKVSHAVETSVEKVQQYIITNSYIKLDDSEIEILRQGYLHNRKADDDILQNRNENRKIYKRQMFLSEEIEKLLENQKIYIAQEKERVLETLIDQAPNRQEAESYEEESDSNVGEDIGLLNETPPSDIESMWENIEETTAQDIIVGDWKGKATIIETYLADQDKYDQDEVNELNRQVAVGTTFDLNMSVEKSEDGYQFIYENGHKQYFQLVGNEIKFDVHFQEGSGRADFNSHGIINPEEKTLEMIFDLYISLYDENYGDVYYELKVKGEYYKQDS